MQISKCYIIASAVKIMKFTIQNKKKILKIYQFEKEAMLIRVGKRNIFVLFKFRIDQSK